MYAGKLVELSPIERIVEKPLHPYSDLLLQSVPTLDGKADRLVSIPGMPPCLIDLPSGCYFAPRCPSAMPHCTDVMPMLQPPPTTDATWPVISTTKSIRMKPARQPFRWR